MKCSKYNLFDKVGPLQYTKWKSFSGIRIPPTTNDTFPLLIPSPTFSCGYLLFDVWVWWSGVDSEEQNRWSNYSPS